MGGGGGGGERKQEAKLLRLFCHFFTLNLKILLSVHPGTSGADITYSISNRNKNATKG